MNKFVSFVVTSMSFLTLLAGPGYSSNNNGNKNEGIEECNQRLVLQQEQATGYETAIDSSGSKKLEIFDSSSPKAPGFLSLRSSLQLQSACCLFMTSSAAEEMNNLCTNFAYEQALQLYAQHGDRFIEPFTAQIHGLIFGVLESSIKNAIGVGDLFSAIKKFTGLNVTGKQHLTEAANSTLPQSFLNALRLKFVTDLLNKHVVGPYVVAPNIAYAINKINLGQIVQEQLFVRLHSILKGFEDELADRSVLELKEYAARIIALNQELDSVRAGLLEVDTTEVSTLKAEIEKLNADARAELGWTEVINPLRNSTPKEQEVTQKCQMLASLEKDLKEKLKIRQERLDKVKQLESEIESLTIQGQATAHALIAAGRYNNQGQVTEYDIRQADLLLQPTCTLRELFGEISYVGVDINRYMSPCPHIQPGYISSLMTGENITLVARVPRSYLRFTGVTGSVERLRDDLHPQAFTRTFDETVNKINNVRTSIAQIGDVQIMATQEQLEGQGYVMSVLTRIGTLVRGTSQVLLPGVRAVAEGITIHHPAVNHVRRIQNHALQGIVTLNVAIAPARVAYNFFINAGQIWAVNYLSNVVMGVPVTDHAYLIAFELAIMQQLYILLYHMA